MDVRHIHALIEENHGAVMQLLAEIQETLEDISAGVEEIESK